MRNKTLAYSTDLNIGKYLYLLIFPEKPFLKIGIGSHSLNRVAVFNKKLGVDHGRSLIVTSPYHGNVQALETHLLSKYHGFSIAESDIPPKLIGDGSTELRRIECLQLVTRDIFSWDDVTVNSLSYWFNKAMARTVTPAMKAREQKPPSVQVATKISQEDFDFMENWCKMDKRSVSWFIRHAIKDSIEKLRKEEGAR